MALQVVRLAAEHAVLFRERLELAALRTVPVGGLRLRQGAVPEALSVSEGMLGEAGKGAERVRGSDGLTAHALGAAVISSARTKNSRSFHSPVKATFPALWPKTHDKETACMRFKPVFFFKKRITTTMFRRCSLDARCYVMASSFSD